MENKIDEIKKQLEEEGKQIDAELKSLETSHNNLVQQLDQVKTLIVKALGKKEEVEKILDKLNEVDKNKTENPPQ